jgi:glyoxylase-like metal-dependent hydrolase (beta-lactamase superfamily II)
MLQIPVSTFLIQSLLTSEYVLVDAGYDSHVAELVSAVKTQVGTGKLVGIVITHGHLDHIAAVPQLIREYPECKVYAHENEIPFLTGETKYSSLRGDGWTFNMTKWLQQQSSTIISKENIKPITDGEVLFGNVRCIKSHGHTPGSMSYVHVPSGLAFIGDALMFYSAFGAPCCSVLKASTSDLKSAYESLEKFCGLDITKYYPSHDQRHEGVTKQEILQFLDTVK